MAWHGREWKDICIALGVRKYRNIFNYSYTFPRFDPCFAFVCYVLAYTDPEASEDRPIPTVITIGPIILQDSGSVRSWHGAALQV
jgi:hypothetical protein